MSIRTTDEWIFLEPSTSPFHSAASLAAFDWVERSSLLLLVVAMRCCIFFLITPSVSPIVRRVMNSVKFEVPSAVLMGIQVRVVMLNRLLNVYRRSVIF